VGRNGRENTDRCPLWVRSGHDGANFRCLFYPQKRTLPGGTWMSAKFQKRL
jgi:hypothetical protein